MLFRSKVEVVNEMQEVLAFFTQAWKNASAGKKYIKAMVQELTPRKSVKLIPSEEKDAKGKPVRFSGTLNFKA